MKNRATAVLIALLLATGCKAPANDPSPLGSWTAHQASTHADRYNDKDLWQQDRLAMDIAFMREAAPELALLPFPKVAFPTPDYQLVGHDCPGLGVAPLGLPSDLQGSISWIYRPGDDGAADPMMAVIAGSSAPLENVEQWAISRSHPHYFFQGTIRSDYGELRWAALRMADRTEVGIVNGRLLDLSQGNIILVRQQPDGSIRLRQHRTRSGGGDGQELWQAPVSAVLANPNNLAFLTDS